MYIFNLLADDSINLQPGVAILLSVLIVLVAGAAIFFLFRGIRKERNRYISEKLKVRDLNKEKFDEIVHRRFASATKHTHFSVMAIILTNSEEIKNSFGGKQHQRILNELFDRFTSVLPKYSKVCLYDSDTVTVYLDEDLDRKALSDLCLYCINEGRKSIDLITKVKVYPKLAIAAVSYGGANADEKSFKNNLIDAIDKAKSAGENKYSVFTSELADINSEEYKYYREIRSAIDAKEFSLYYQPIYNIKDDKLFAFESLLRWNHRTLGVLTPNKFLHIMEESGDINWVGKWAFEQLILSGIKYNSRHQDKAIFSFNLSPKQLSDTSLAEDLAKLVKKHHASTGDYCLEVAEFALFDKVPEVSENLRRLKEYGFKLAIDDYGLEMSTLKRLDNMQLDWVKLDKSFVEESQDDFLMGGVVGALVEFAEQKNLVIVAEGIEDKVVLEYVKGKGINFGQGYFIGVPKAPNEYEI